MTAEVEALLARLDSAARNKEHPMLPTGIIVYKQLAADASAVIRAQVDEIAKLNEKYATLFNKTQSTAMHASAPEGCGCSDCAIDQEACPVCYRVWWNKRHPNTNIVAADDSEVFAANRRAEAAEAKLTAAARQQPVGWISDDDMQFLKRDGECTIYQERQDIVFSSPQIQTPVYAAPVPAVIQEPVPLAYMDESIPWRTDGWACVWLNKEKGLVANMPLYTAPIPAAVDVLLSIGGKTYASPSAAELASGVPIPVANLKELSTIPAGDAVSVRADVVSFLHGEGLLDGVHFGGRPDTQSGPYWWRKYLPESK
jgi:hypothetical protein